MNSCQCRNLSRVRTVVGAVGSLLVIGCSKPAETVLPSITPNQLQVSSPDFSEGATIPDEFSSYNSNKIPTVKWTAGPGGTKSYALLLEDPDAPGLKPFVHWLVADIPPTKLEEPGAGRILKNQNGEVAYYGPHPPSGAPHHYIFHVFALDTSKLDATDRDSAVSAMKGHVLAEGQLTALFGHS